MNSLLNKLRAKSDPQGSPRLGSAGSDSGLQEEHTLADEQDAFTGSLSGRLQLSDELMKTPTDPNKGLLSSFFYFIVYNVFATKQDTTLLKQVNQKMSEKTCISFIIVFQRLTTLLFLNFTSFVLSGNEPCKAFFRVPIRKTMLPS